MDIRYKDYISEYQFKESVPPKFENEDIKFAERDMEEPREEMILPQDDRKPVPYMFQAPKEQKYLYERKGPDRKDLTSGKNYPSQGKLYLAVKNTADTIYRGVKERLDETKENSALQRETQSTEKNIKPQEIAERVSENVKKAANESKILYYGLMGLIILVTITIIITAVTESRRRIDTSGYPEDVLKWQAFVVERCAANNDPDSDVDLTKFTAAILTTIWQESGGRSEGSGGDLMQCRASGLWDYNEKPPGWTIEQYSIDVGIRYFYMGLKDWNVTDPSDLADLQIVAQGYNYSWDFLRFMRKNGYTTWTEGISAEYARSRGGRYGHVTYGSEWLEKYQSGSLGEGATTEEFLNMKMCADQYLGFPYVWGGKTPETSFDCSGFVCWVINNCGNGWDIGYKDAEGLKNFCTKTDTPAPGDLVFFYGTYGSYGGEYATHVGIYTGDGMMIHASSSSGIAYTDIEESSYHQSHFLCYGRLPLMSGE